MKVKIIEGSPEELAEYEARTGTIGEAPHTNMPDPAEEPLPAGDGQTIAGTDFEDEAVVRSFIYGRAREPRIGGRVDAYVRQVLDAGVEVEIGSSKTSKDGRGDYLLVYDAGPRHYGAVAYVNAKNGGLTLRLTKDDVADVSDQVKFRDVDLRNVHQVNCPLTTSDAIELALKLTQRALDKIRHPGNGDAKDDRASAR
jgi:hypothetical protein